MENLSANLLKPESMERRHAAFVSVKYAEVHFPTQNSFGDLHDKWLFDGHPVEIIHDTGSRVWVGSSYADELPEGVVPVGDGLTNGYDLDGGRIVSLPVEWCTFLSAEEAENIEKMIEADERLMDYAR